MIFSSIVAQCQFINQFRSIHDEFLPSPLKAYLFFLNVYTRAQRFFLCLYIKGSNHSTSMYIL